jgi:hypothetical protein
MEGGSLNAVRSQLIVGKKEVLVPFSAINDHCAAEACPADCLGINPS